MGNSHKGSAFERTLCKEFSAWVANGFYPGETKKGYYVGEKIPKDDVFWRTAGSGARATTRNKKGKDSFGGYGDMCANHPVGIPFVNTFTFEFKRGYKWDLASIFEKRKANVLVSHLEQAIESMLKAKTPSFILIEKKDRRVPLVFHTINTYYFFKNKERQKYNTLILPKKFLGKYSGLFNNIKVTPLDFFLDCSPEKIYEKYTSSQGWKYASESEYYRKANTMFGIERT